MIRVIRVIRGLSRFPAQSSPSRTRPSGEIIEGCHRAVPGSRFVVIPNSGHSTYFEQAEAFNAAVMGFLLETV